MRLVVLAALVAAPVFAQTTTTIVTFGVRETPSSTAEEMVIGPSACGTERALFWIWQQLTPSACGSMRLWATTGECGDAPGTNDVEYPSVNLLLLATRSGSFTIKVNELPGFTGDSATPCGSTSGNVKNRICASLPTSFQCGGFGQTTSTTRASPAFLITYDVTPPDAPVITAVAARDRALKLTFTATSDTASVIPFVRAQGETNFRELKEQQISSTTREVLVEDLLNATTYDVMLRARDGAGNTSVDSEPAAGTPVRTVGFWGAFRDAGGTGSTGCSGVPGLPLIGIVAWVLSRRRVR